VVVFSAEMHLMSRSDYDDSAGAMFVPMLLLMPSVLLLVLASLCGLVGLTTFLVKKLKN
jgi:hypothetical protein